MKQTILAVCSITIILFAGCSFDPATDINSIEKGIFNAVNMDFSGNETVRLDGEWEFYANKLLTFDDIKKTAPDIYANVPGTWNEYIIDGKKFGGSSCGTYRLHVKTGVSKDTLLGLRVYNFSSAYKLYINDKLAASNGRTADNAAEETGEYRPQAVFFNAPSSGFDIIVQVSNFQYARGGFWYSMYLGSAKGIQSLHNTIIEKEIFLLGAVIIIALMFFAVFLLRRELKYSLYFSCLCIVMVVAIDTVGQFILVGFFPNISLKTVILIWYSSTTWLMFFLILYMHELFKSKFSTVICRIYLGFAIISQLLYLFTPTLFYTRYAHISNFIEILAASCTVVIVAIGIRNGYRHGWLNILSMIITVITYIHDILYWTNYINSSFGEMTYAGVFLFIFIQTLIQAKRIKTFHEERVAAELSFLHAQIKPHFLYNALNSIISISRYDADKARDLLTDFSNYLRRSFDIKNTDSFVPLSNEIELVRAYTGIEKARFEERLEVAFDIPGNLDVRVPALILQPLAENAIIHGILPKEEGGRVDISAKKDGKYILFKVSDNGVGMDTAKQRSVLSDNRTGVGLYNIDKRLKRLYGKGLEIKSGPGKGTEIAYSIRLSGKEAGI